MRIVVNGEEQELRGPVTVDEALVNLGYADKFIAVAINQTCIPKGRYGSTRVQEGDRLEILGPMSGG